MHTKNAGSTRRNDDWGTNCTRNVSPTARSFSLAASKLNTTSSARDWSARRPSRIFQRLTVVPRLSSAGAIGTNSPARSGCPSSVRPEPMKMVDTRALAATWGSPATTSRSRSPPPTKSLLSARMRLLAAERSTKRR